MDIPQAALLQCGFSIGTGRSIRSAYPQTARARGGAKSGARGAFCGAVPCRIER